MKALRIALAAAAALTLAATAEAKKPSLWAKCDGYPKPESTATKVAKGLAALGTLGLSGLPESFNASHRAPGEAGVEACTTALADPDAASVSWIRKVTLNQWLAIHQLEAKRPEAALAALDAAVAAASGPNATDPMFVRSTGVTLDVLRSITLLRLGRTDEGLASARRAASARPWSARVQILALGLLGLDQAVEPTEYAIADRLRSIDPSALSISGSMYVRGGRYAEAWALYKAKRAQAPPVELSKSGLPLVSFKADFDDDLLAAFAAARSGEREAATAIFTQTIAEAKASAGQLAAFRRETDADQLKQHELSFIAPIERWRPMVDAAGLLASGDAAAAQDALLAAAEWPASPLLTSLISDLRAKLPAEARKGLVSIDPAATQAKLMEDSARRIDRIVGADIFEMLPEPEDEGRLNGFSKQFGLGLKPTGFKSKKLENGLTRIEFVGSVSSPLAVEEMTLLRAARLALESGNKGFVVEKRSDFTRWSQMTMNGSPIGNRTLAGYMTQIEVRFVPDAAMPGAIDAAALEAELAPIYVRAGKA